MDLKNYLRLGVTRAYRQLSRSLAGLEPEDARRGADPNWKQYRHGTGLDGSIEGIVRHVAAWKHVAAAGLESGTFPDPESLAPPAYETWTALLERLRDGHHRLTRALDALPPADLDREVTLEGETMPLWAVLTHMLEHDQYHAGQINLLRQQYGHSFER
jgi:uncharacterized damage-inducible protein DinB